MDDKTSKLINEISIQYSSVRAFARACGVPHGTVVSALNKGIEGMSYIKVFKMCECLNIDLETFEPKNNKASSDSDRLLAYYLRLSDIKKEKVIEYIKDIT